MILVIGGRGQGKLEYVLKKYNTDKNQIANCESDDIRAIFNKRIIYRLHSLVYRLINDGIEPIEYITENLNSEHVIICDEIGCGVVPMDKNERLYRDCVGELCCRLAESAGSVERIICGISMKIK